MEIDTLREFTYLAKNLNYTRTAEKCHISQPVLTRHIQSLEKELHAKLFERSKGDVRLTAKGALLAANAQKILSIFDATVEQMRNEQFRYDDVVRIGYLGSLTDILIDEAYQIQLERFPRTKVEFISSWEQRTVELLERNKVDVAIGIVFGQSYPNEYEFLEIYQDNYDILIPDDDPLTDKTTITIDDLSGRTVLVPSDRDNPIQYARIKRTLLRNEAIVGVHDTLFDKHDSVALARAGYGVSMVRHKLVDSLQKSGVVAVPFDCEDLKYRVGAIWKVSNSNQARVNFIDILRELVSDRNSCVGRLPISESLFLNENKDFSVVYALNV